MSLEANNSAKKAFLNSQLNKSVSTKANKSYEHVLFCINTDIPSFLHERN